MVYLQALVIFAVITTTIWFVAVAVYQGMYATEELRRHKDFGAASCLVIVLGTLMSFVPFPLGYLFTLLLWAFVSWGILELPRLKAFVLFALLAAFSMLSRLAILGVLSY